MINSTTNLITHIGNGVTVDFSYPFRLMTASHIRIYVAGEPVGSGYSINTSNSTVTFDTAPDNGDIVILTRDTDPIQETQYPEGIKFPTQTVERDLDYRTLTEQDIYHMASRSLRIHPAFASGNEDLRLASNANARASRTVVFTSSGQGIELGPTADEVEAAQGYAENAFTSMQAAQAAANSAQTVSTIVNSKGDLLVASANDTLDRLAVGTNGKVLTTNSSATLGVSWESPGSFITQLPAGTIYGFHIDNGTDTANDINIQPGEAVSDSDDSTERVLLSTFSVGAMGKRLDATWAEGHDAGMRSSSVALANTTYHIFIIRVGGVDDYGADTDINAANLIADHSATHYRRIFSVVRSGGSIRQFQHDRDHVYWLTPVADYNGNVASTGTIIQLTVPSGILPIALCNLSCIGGTSKGVCAFHVEQNVAAVPSALDNTPGACMAATYTDVSDSLRVAASIQMHTSSVGQIRLSSIATSTVLVVTHGYIDYRGRLG